MTSSSTIGAIVAENFRTAAVFQSYGIDFCCRGNRTIDEACEGKGIDAAVVREKIEAVMSAPAGSEMNYDEWDLAFLGEYIVRVHHEYVRRMIPVLRTHTRKIAAVHGTAHPELLYVAEHFAAVASELEEHMEREEQVLFPYIGALEKAVLAGKNLPWAPFGRVANPIARMRRDHEAAGDEMASIREATNDYTPPVDACTTYRVTFQELADFEADLHKHVHLENNILFPKAVQLEALSDDGVRPGDAAQPADASSCAIPARVSTTSSSSTAAA